MAVVKHHLESCRYLKPAAVILNKRGVFFVTADRPHFNMSPKSAIKIKFPQPDDIANHNDCAAPFRMNVEIYAFKSAVTVSPEWICYNCFP